MNFDEQARQMVDKIMVRAEIEANRILREETDVAHGPDDRFFRRSTESKFSFYRAQTSPPLSEEIEKKLPDICRRAVVIAIKEERMAFGSLLLGYPVRAGKIYDAFE